MSILSSYNDMEFSKIVSESSSLVNCLYNLGYNAVSGSVSQLVKQRIVQLNLDTSHFSNKSINKVVRTPENIFIENSTADQSTLRRFYKNGNYTEYKCSICNQEPFWNGKKLTLILDHVNGKNHDDRLENLRWVCPNCNQQLDTTGGKNQSHKEHQINLCQNCGTPISKTAKHCIKCSHLLRQQNNIEREELKKLIRSTSFTAIGKKYNVSDNAVRKWCDKYNLPRKASEIKKYSDEEWELI